jgi:hypothetical protein
MTRTNASCLSTPEGDPMFRINGRQALPGMSPRPAHHAITKLKERPTSREFDGGSGKGLGSHWTSYDPGRAPGNRASSGLDPMHRIL